MVNFLLDDALPKLLILLIIKYMKNFILIIFFGLCSLEPSLSADPEIRVKYNFEKDLQHIMSSDMSSRGLNLASCDNLRQSIFNYLNTVRRIIPKQQYSIEISPRLKAKIKSLPQNLQVGIKSVISEASSGADLLPRHSRRIKNNDYSDPLLNDWGIFHLHLGDTIESDGFIKRSGELLYVFIHKDHLYFLDVLKHEWADRSLVEVIHKNWPNAISRHRLIGIDLVEDVAPTDANVSLFRKAGLSYLYKTADGTVYGPLGGGYAASGDSIDAVRRSHMTLGWLNWVEESVNKNKNNLANIIYEATGKKLDSLNLKLVNKNGKFYVLETQSGAMYLVNSD